MIGEGLVPYTKIQKMEIEGRDKWCFYNEDTGERHCSDTRKKAVSHMRLLYHVEAGGKLTKTKK